MVAVTQMARRLGTMDATAIGLGSMLGAGVFAVFAPAAASAGGAVLIALVIAGFVAYCNATASAQLAATYPASGGTYLFGREVLGPWWGFLAGWGFVIGKTASCAAMALTFAAYAAPGWERPLAAAAVVVLTVVNCFGITRTALLTKVLLSVVLIVLIGAVALALPAAEPAGDWFTHGPLGVLQAAGLLFFAFAGYARIATLSEEVREPARTIPRAILGALGGAMVIYLAVGVTLLLVLGPQRLAESRAPLADMLTVAGHPGLTVAVRIGAAAASLGALLALITGIGRTAMAMARNRDLPPFLAAVDSRFGVPRRAEVAVGATVCVLVLLADLRGVVGFSSFGVLIYYAVTNASAYRQPASERRRPRRLNVAGFIGCVVLALTLPFGSVLIGAGVLAVGLLARLAIRS